jgi:hypothetical protein
MPGAIADDVIGSLLDGAGTNASDIHLGVAAA